MPESNPASLQIRLRESPDRPVGSGREEDFAAVIVVVVVVVAVVDLEGDAVRRAVGVGGA